MATTALGKAVHDQGIWGDEHARGGPLELEFRSDLKRSFEYTKMMAARTSSMHYSSHTVAAPVMPARLCTLQYSTRILSSCKLI